VYVEPDFRFRGLGYVALNVTDLERSSRFYDEIVGLERVASAKDATFLRCSAQHHDVILYRGSRPGLRRVAWQLESALDLQNLERALDSSRLAVEVLPVPECEQLGQGKTLRVRDPVCGLLHEFFADRQPTSRAYKNRITNITRLGHVVLGVKDFDRFVIFARRLNFRLSDHMPGFAAWLRCFPNPLHHSLAVQKSDGERLHHVNFMVDSIDDVGRAANRLRRANVPIVFGPGRHLPSLSIFLYFTDPDGLTLEYSHGMEEFPEHGARDPRALEKSLEVVDIWGGRPESGFGAIGAIEQG
jgi:2,3-dihydroxy-p-cumate/2,3-dihydroxybenzoate 3,4-dioxygenase